MPDFVGGRIGGDERRVTKLAGQRQLWFVRQFFQVGAPGGEGASFGLEQQRGEIAQRQFRFFAYRVEVLNAFEQFRQRVGVSGFGEALQRFDAILPVQSFAFQQRDVNELAARRFDQFLVGEPAENVGRRPRTLRQEQRFFGRLVVGCARRR